MNILGRINGLLKRFGYRLSPAPGFIPLRLLPLKSGTAFRLHDYGGGGGYEAYRDMQVRWNKAKLDKVFADPETLESIARDIERRGLKTGICHGARNGYEVEWFRDRLGTEVIGTDISDTATQFPHMVVQDFHEPRGDWLGKWDFIYTNSLDQAMMPDKALLTWADQLSPNGRIYIEHTMLHAAASSSETDPFGADPQVMPYLLLKWGLTPEAMIEMDVTGKNHVWIFVVRQYGAQ